MKGDAPHTSGQRTDLPDPVERFRALLVRWRRRLTVSDEVTDNLLRSIPLWIASLLVGVAAVLYARLFAAAEGTGLQLFEHRPWLVFLVTPLCFVIAWLIVRYGAPYARGSGIPQVIAALESSGTEHERNVPLLVGPRVIPVKVLSSVVMVLGGGAIGREGPTIQISAALFRLVGRFLPQRWPKYSERVMVLAGSAAGLAAAFNTPLGGIVFAIEELSKSHFTSFRTSLLTSVIIAGMTAQILLGPYLYLGFPAVDGATLPMVGLVLLVGAAGGTAGALFSKLVLAFLSFRERLAGLWRPMLVTAMLGTALGAVSYFVSPSALGSGKETMLTLLFGVPREEAGVTAAVRFAGPLLSFTSGAAAGVFAPSLSCGASLGALCSSLFSLDGPQANVLILAGMVAFLTAVTRSPFTSAILVLEMTDRHSLIAVLMLAGLISSAAAWMVDRRSLYARLTERYLAELSARPSP